MKEQTLWVLTFLCLYSTILLGKPKVGNYPMTTASYQLALTQTVAYERVVLQKMTAKNIEKETGKKLNLLDKAFLKVVRFKIKRQFKKLKKAAHNIKAEDCDVMLLKDGRELKVKIKELNPTLI